MACPDDNFMACPDDNFMACPDDLAHSSKVGNSNITFSRISFRQKKSPENFIYLS
jgi:hypothetical protein